MASRRWKTGCPSSRKSGAVRFSLNRTEKRGNLDELNTEVAGKPAEPRIESSGNVGAEKPAEIITGKKKPIDHTAVAMTGEHGLMVNKAGADGMDDKLPKGYEP